MYLQETKPCSCPENQLWLDSSWGKATAHRFICWGQVCPHSFTTQGGKKESFCGCSITFGQREIAPILPYTNWVSCEKPWPWGGHIHMGLPSERQLRRYQKQSKTPKASSYSFLRPCTRQLHVTQGVQCDAESIGRYCVKTASSREGTWAFLPGLSVW